MRLLLQLQIVLGSMTLDTICAPLKVVGTILLVDSLSSISRKYSLKS